MYTHTHTCTQARTHTHTHTHTRTHTLCMQIRSTQRCFFVFLPPNFGLSKQFLHFPQSGFKQFTQSEQLWRRLYFQGDGGVLSTLVTLLVLRAFVLLFDVLLGVSDFGVLLCLLKCVSLVCVLLLLGDSTLYFLGRPFLLLGRSPFSTVSTEGSSTLK